jgi:hypothetical protein
MDDDAYRLTMAWLKANQTDPEGAELIREQYLAGNISHEQAIGAWLALAAIIVK